MAEPFNTEIPSSEEKISQLIDRLVNQTLPEGKSGLAKRLNKSKLYYMYSNSVGCTIAPHSGAARILLTILWLRFH